MAVARKVFRVAKSVSLADAASKLKGFRSEEEFEEGDYKFTLVTEVMNLMAKADGVGGMYSHDYVLHVFHRGTVVPLPKTVEAIFSFIQFK